MRTLAIAISILAAAVAMAQWPTFHGDNQRSGRSSVPGPSNPTIKWTVDLGGPMINSPVIGPDRTIYTGSVWAEELVPKAYINAINPDGTFKWRFETTFIDDQSVATPAIGPEGNVYVGTATGVFYALSSTGAELWRYTASSKINTHAVVNSNGTVYAKMDGLLLAFSPAGAQLWQFPLGSNTPSSPALAEDGTIYAQGASAFYAINPNGTLKWSANIGDSWITPAVAPNGAVIRPTWFDTRALNPANGSILWSRSDGTDSYTSPAVDLNNNVYFVDEYKLRKVSPTGQLLWQQTFNYGGFLEKSYSAPLLDSEGRLYFGLGTGKRWAFAASKGLVAYNAATGAKLFNFLMPETPSTSMPAIGNDGTLYIGCLDGRLYALEDAWDQLPPASYQLFRGILVSGNLANLLQSDDDRMIIRPGLVLSSGERPISLIVSAIGPTANPGQMRLVVESHASAPNIRQFVEAYDYAAATWVEIDARTASTTDQVVSLDLPSPSRFVDQSTREVRARISYRATGPVLSWPWQARIDHVMWQLR